MNKELYELSYSLKKDFQKKVLIVILFICGIYAFINLMLAYVIFPLRQNSVSMAPDIVKSSCILFTPLDKSIGRGDVVLIMERDSDSNSKLKKFLNMAVLFFTAQQFDLNNYMNNMGKNGQIRRVIGIPGDEIYMRDYVMYIKPAGENFFLTEFELVKKPYNVNINAAPGLWDSSIGVVGSFDAIKLGKNEYFVLGDSRNSCLDSRLWGPVKIDDIKASALVQYFPLNKLRFF